MPVVHVISRPALRRPILLAAFGGWGDAGSAASAALVYLLGDPRPPACARVDPEVSFDFTVERPITRRGEDGRWQLDYPEIGLYPVMRPDSDHDLLILRGPEPHTAWPTISRGIANLAADLGVETALTLGAFIGPVSHRRTPIMRRTPSSALDAWLASLGFEDTPYAGPTAFVTAQMHALDEAGVPAASLWAAAAPYLGSPNPAVSLALLEAAERALDTQLDLGRLAGMATDFLRKVEATLREKPEVAERLGRLVELEPIEDEPSTSAIDDSVGEPDLPSGRDLVEELERFLREQRGGAGPSAG